MIYFQSFHQRIAKRKKIGGSDLIEIVCNLFVDQDVECDHILLRGVARIPLFEMFARQIILLLEENPETAKEYCMLTMLQTRARDGYEQKSQKTRRKAAERGNSYLRSAGNPGATRSPFPVDLYLVLG
jgi:hypothetical protein